MSNLVIFEAEIYRNIFAWIEFSKGSNYKYRNVLMEELMSKKKHVQGIGDKEQKMYEQIVKSAKKTGRYGKRAEEVAARTVLKHHKQEGHPKGK
ncbi:MAG: hypothetical protein JWO53_876 [Chlamydiia bacterium]|nr:hypothetical protein [Chlamydiia bacterium]